MEVIGFENYKIYEDGRVFSKIKNRFLKPQKNKDGYVFIGLTGEKKKIC
jgi:hypothetical protein